MQSNRFNKCLEIIRKGNPRGIEDIYHAYYGKIKYSAFALTKDDHASEDIASSVLKYILEKADKIPFVECPDAWILTMSRSFALSHIRKASKTVSLDNNIIDNVSAQESNDTLRFSFSECFLTLTEVEQKILLWHYMYGYKYEEISKILDRPPGTIKSDIRKIKAKLRHLKNKIPDET